MRIEIGEKMTTIEALELIKNNNKGFFSSENSKIFFNTDSIPKLPINNQYNNQPTQQYTQRPIQQRQNSGDRMGDLLNKMCGI